MNIIFVCSGNTCRSPFAEGYLNSLNVFGVNVQSRGLSVSGLPVSENSKKIAKSFGFDISSHTSKSFDANDFNADYIFTMSNSHRSFLIDNGGDKNKIFVLGNGIPDPYGGNIEVYKNSLFSIANQVDKLYFEGFFSNIKIVPFDESYIKFIAETEKENFSEPWSESSITESAMNNTVFFIAEKDNLPIGYVGLNYVLDEGYITSIAVTKDNRGIGAATMLLNKCFSFAREKNLSFISLEVRVSNKNAKSLYKKLGFNKEGLRKNFYRKPNEDANIMTRRFNF